MTDTLARGLALPSVVLQLRLPAENAHLCPEAPTSVTQRFPALAPLWVRLPAAVRDLGRRGPSAALENALVPKPAEPPAAGPQPLRILLPRRLGNGEGLPSDGPPGGSWTSPAVTLPRSSSRTPLGQPASPSLRRSPDGSRAFQKEAARLCGSGLGIRQMPRAPKSLLWSLASPDPYLVRGSRPP